MAGDGVAGFGARCLAHHEAVPRDAVGGVGEERTRDAASGREEVFDAEGDEGTEGDVEACIREIGLFRRGGLVDIDAKMDVADAIRRVESLEDVIVGDDVFPRDAARFADADDGGEFEQIDIAEEVAHLAEVAHGLLDLEHGLLGGAGDFLAVRPLEETDVGPLDEGLTARAREFDDARLVERDVLDEFLEIGAVAVLEERIPVNGGVSRIFLAEAADFEHHGHGLEGTVGGAADFEGTARACGDVAVARAVDDDARQNELLARFVLDEDAADGVVLQVGFAGGGIEQDVELRVQCHLVEQERHLGGVEGHVPEAAPGISLGEFFAEFLVEAKLVAVVKER